MSTVAAVHIRGACPGLSAPMPTGDGLLVRLLPLGTMTLDAFAGLCAAARACGNGIVEITARGSIQIRGLSAASAPRFADAVAALGIAAMDDIPVHTGALAGLCHDEVIDAGALAADLRCALARTQLVVQPAPKHLARKYLAPKHLAPKVSVVVDGGGTLDLDALVADVRLLAEATEHGANLRVSVAGDATSACHLGTVAVADGCQAVLRLLNVIARHGNAARARDIVAAQGSGVFGAAIADLLVANSSAPRTRASVDALGTHSVRDGAVACGFGFAFGHAEATELVRLVEAARACGAFGVRAAAGRVLMVVGLSSAAAPELTRSAAHLGFIVRADDPRLHVIACAGAPICAAGHLPARALAPQVAEIAAAQLGAAFNIHVSGCAKGCAHGRPAALTIVGAPDGCALIANGSARDAPFAVVAESELPARIARHARAIAGEKNHG